MKRDWKSVVKVREKKIELADWFVWEKERKEGRASEEREKRLCVADT